MNAKTLLDSTPVLVPVPLGWSSTESPKTFCVTYRDGIVCTALILANDFEDVDARFYDAGYKGRILSVKLAR